MRTFTDVWCGALGGPRVLSRRFAHGEVIAAQDRIDTVVVLIDAAYSELAVRTLHSLYGLDK